MTEGGANFDTIARFYRLLERFTFGNLLEKTRFHYLPALKHSKRALVLGDGDGRFLARLLAENPNLCVTAIDSSASMLELLRQHCQASVPDVQLRLRTIHADAIAFLPTENYDLIVTHFFLDCLSDADLEILIQRIQPSIIPEALWVFSDFRVPEGALALPTRLLVRILYFAFKVLTGLRVTRLPDHTSRLARSGFSQIAFHHGFGGILTSELWKKAAIRHVPTPTHS